MGTYAAKLQVNECFSHRSPGGGGSYLLKNFQHLDRADMRRNVLCCGRYSLMS